MIRENIPNGNGAKRNNNIKAYYTANTKNAIRKRIANDDN